MPLTPDAIGIGQCLPVEPNRPYRLGAWFRWSSLNPGQEATWWRAARSSPRRNAAGPAVAEDLVVLELVEPQDWVPARRRPSRPRAGARSALCSFLLSAEPDLEANLDRLMLSEDAGIFADGFESGDTVGWSSATGVVPGTRERNVGGK